MIVFERIQEILDSLPNAKEIVVIFITDGEDTVYVKDDLQKYQDFAQFGLLMKTRPNLKSRFMSIGFSRDHQAAFMNEIAGYGSEQGNFTFVDSYEVGYRDNLAKALVEQLEICMASDTDITFKVENSGVPGS